MIELLKLMRTLHSISHFIKIVLVHYYLRDEMAP